MKNFYKPRRIHFIVGFGIIFITLGILKCTHPEWRLPRLANNDNGKSEIKSHTPDSIELQAAKVDKLLLTVRNKPILLRKDGSRVKNRVTSVPRFETSFPDLNDVQLATAKRWHSANPKPRGSTQAHAGVGLHCRQSFLPCATPAPIYPLPCTTGSSTAQCHSKGLQRLVGHKGLPSTQTAHHVGATYKGGRAKTTQL